MIYPLAGIIIGALLGFYRAKRRGGKTLDYVQWAIIHALIGAVIGVIISVIMLRVMMLGS